MIIVFPIINLFKGGSDIFKGALLMMIEDLILFCIYVTSIGSQQM